MRFNLILLARVLLNVTFYAFFGLLVITGCAHQGAKSQSQSQNQSQSQSPLVVQSQPPQIKVEASSGSQNNSQSIDSKVAAKVGGLFQALVQNDDKRAKLSYGRASRSLPDLVQFAVDLKFHNFQHAKTALAGSTMSPEQKEFWGKVLDKKPTRLSKVICEEFKEASKDSGTGSGDSSTANTEAGNLDSAWASFYQRTVSDLASKDGGKSSPAEKTLEQVQCEKEVCTLPQDSSETLLVDSFFDNLHNLKRRDTRNVQANYKNAVKLVGIEKDANVTRESLSHFFSALKAATDNPKQTHFLRRFTGIGRDMRIEDLANRQLGDAFLGDEDDQKMTGTLQKFVSQNKLISAVNRLDYELADCALPPPAPVR